MTELAKTQTQAIAIPKEFQGFTEEEALGGMTPVNEGYLKSYKYFLNRPSTRAKFEIRDNATDQVVWEGSEIKGAVIYYAHEVLRLKKGHVESPDKNEAEFTEEENQILAISYDKANSKGNFEDNGFGAYLTKEHADLQGKLTRLYVIMILPGKEYGTGTNLVAASFSVTTIKSFNALRKSLRAYGMLPLPLVKTNLFFTEAKSESGQVYDRVDFALAKDDGGNLLFAHKSADSYRTSDFGAKLLQEIIETHKAAVENAETGAFGVITERDVTAAPEPTATEKVKEAFNGTDATATTKPIDDDRIPF